MATEYYILINITEQPGRNGVTMWRLTFQGMMSNDTVEMTVDPSYRNFRKKGWEQVVTNPCPWAVYDNLTRTGETTRGGVPVVSADSLAQVIERLESQEQACELAVNSRNWDSPSERYHKLFSYE